jgi:hypothetical protein
MLSVQEQQQHNGDSDDVDRNKSNVLQEGKEDDVVLSSCSLVNVEPMYEEEWFSWVDEHFVLTSKVELRGFNNQNNNDDNETTFSKSSSSSYSYLTLNEVKTEKFNQPYVLHFIENMNGVDEMCNYCLGECNDDTDEDRSILGKMLSLFSVLLFFGR